MDRAAVADGSRGSRSAPTETCGISIPSDPEGGRRSVCDPLRGRFLLRIHHSVGALRDPRLTLRDTFGIKRMWVMTSPTGWVTIDTVNCRANGPAVCCFDSQMVGPSALQSNLAKTPSPMDWARQIAGPSARNQANSAKFECASECVEAESCAGGRTTFHVTRSSSLGCQTNPILGIKKTVTLGQDPHRSHSVATLRSLSCRS